MFSFSRQLILRGRVSFVISAACTWHRVHSRLLLDLWLRCNWRTRLSNSSSSWHISCSTLFVKIDLSIWRRWVLTSWMGHLRSRRNPVLLNLMLLVDVMMSTWSILSTLLNISSLHRWLKSMHKDFLVPLQIMNSLLHLLELLGHLVALLNPIL